MTSPKYIDRGVERVIANTCRECAYHKKVYTGDITVMIVICENEKSDHFGHALDWDHPACIEFGQIILTKLGKDTTDATGN